MCTRIRQSTAFFNFSAYQTRDKVKELRICKTRLGFVGHGDRSGLVSLAHILISDCSGCEAQSPLPNSSTRSSLCARKHRLTNAHEGDYRVGNIRQSGPRLQVAVESKGLWGPSGSCEKKPLRTTPPKSFTMGLRCNISAAPWPHHHPPPGRASLGGCFGKRPGRGTRSGSKPFMGSGCFVRSFAQGVVLVDLFGAQYRLTVQVFPPTGPRVGSIHSSPLPPRSHLLKK